AQSFSVLVRDLRIVFFVILEVSVAGWWVYVDGVLPRQESDRSYQRFAEAIRRQVPAPMPVILFRTKPHLLTFHLGPPVDTLLEWENLDTWAGRPGCRHVVMPAPLAAEWPRYIKSGRLVEVLRSTQLADKGLERELVLLRTQPNPPAPGRCPPPAKGRRGQAGSLARSR